MREYSSFRDPDGFVFFSNCHLYRAVTFLYRDNYDHLINSGLYAKLTKEGYLIPHNEVELIDGEAQGMYKILEPEMVQFISYPYEWSFSQLKDAALITLEIQKIALEFGMSLKDASAYNVQFHNGHPVFIDTLSFEMYSEDQPWTAYKQFCQHFLAPLSLMGFCDIRLNGLMKNYLDGIPLDLAHSLLPIKTRFNFGLLLHIHLHASAQKKYNSNSVKVSDLKRKFPKNSFLVLLATLKKTINRINWEPKGTEWGEYTEPGVHNQKYLSHKKQLVSEFINMVKPEIIWDMGSNTGEFSRIAIEKGGSVIAFDIDPACVEINYRNVKTRKEENVLPLLFDLVNPSPSLGWANNERNSLTGRSEGDLIMALALIHHLCISNNLPFDKIAEYFSSLSKWLIIEFVPKEDDKVQVMLKNRVDIFSTYTLEEFENVFRNYYSIEKVQNIQDSKRTIYLMKRRHEIFRN
jgi:ribosomal protein L11 methylase PrmA